VSSSDNEPGRRQGYRAARYGRPSGGFAEGCAKSRREPRGERPSHSAAALLSAASVTPPGDKSIVDRQLTLYCSRLDAPQ
jgi:hypothetical protein